MAHVAVMLWNGVPPDIQKHVFKDALAVFMAVIKLWHALFLLWS